MDVDSLLASSLLLAFLDFAGHMNFDESGRWRTGLHVRDKLRDLLIKHFQRHEPLDLERDHQKTVLGVWRIGTANSGARQRSSQKVNHEPQAKTLVSDRAAKRQQGASGWTVEFFRVRGRAPKGIDDPADRNGFSSLQIVSHFAFGGNRSEEHTSELQSPYVISYA